MIYVIKHWMSHRKEVVMAKKREEKKLMGVRVKQNTYDQLVELAELRGTSVSAQVNQALVQYVTTDGKTIVGKVKV